jgi:hypothetical protein
LLLADFVLGFCFLFRCAASSSLKLTPNHFSLLGDSEEASNVSTVLVSPLNSSSSGPHKIKYQKPFQKLRFFELPPRAVDSELELDVIVDDVEYAILWIAEAFDAAVPPNVVMIYFLVVPTCV